MVIKQALQNVKNYILDFIYTPTYIVMVALLVLFFYLVNLPLIMLGLMVLLASFIFIESEDLTPILPMLCMVLFIFNDLRIAATIEFYIVLLPAGVSLIYHFFKYKRKLVKGKLILPLIIYSIALALGGIFSPHISSYMTGLATVLALGPVILIIYIVFSQYVIPPKNFDIKKYFCILIISIAFLVSLQLVTLMLEKLSVLFAQNKPYSFKKILVGELGWGNVNAVACLLLFSLPAGFYLLTTSKHFTVNVIIIFLTYVFITLTHSQSVLGLSLAFLIPLIWASYNRMNKTNKKNLLVFCGLIIALLIICVIIFNQMIPKAIHYFKNEISNDSGRTKLYKNAFDFFCKYPIFGIGQGYNALGIEQLFGRNGNFHSTLFHTLATMGLFGFIAYVYYLVNRIRILVANNSTFNFMMFIAFILFEIHAMVDACEFNAIPLMTIVTITLVVVERLNNVKEDKLPLSL
ncbi:MAG: O-antigen ligase family protein [Clostridia bacterium]|nr:O-antigen ligase family protein [Clostridia bacterium]